MTHPLAPTTALPPLALLQTYSAVPVQEALGTLRKVYFPSAAASINAVPALKQTLTDAVHSTRPRKRAERLVHHDDGVPDSGYASAEEEDEVDCIEYEDICEVGDDEEELELLRSDELERGFAIKWLTGLVKRSDTWVFVDGEDEEQQEQELQLREGIIDDASKLLARFAGDDEPEEAVTRKFSFPFYTHLCRQASESPQRPLIVELNDAPLDTHDHTSVGLQSWGSAIILAERICADPVRYLGVHRYPSNTRDVRVLELGAGTGLLSIAASHIFSRLKTRAQVTATDYHPSVLENLEQNVATNGVDVVVEALDWSCPTLDALEPVDVVLAADVIYHPEHAGWIRDCVERVMEGDGVFWLIIPLRTIGRHEGMSRTVEDVFPDAGLVKSEGMGRRLAVVHRKEVGKREGIGRADEGGYRLFEIRWV